MRLAFSAKYKVGDKVQVLPGEHNFNWQGKVGKVVDVGIDLHAVAYIVEFADEVFKPCFLKEDLRLAKRKSNKVGRNRIIIDTRFDKGDKVCAHSKSQVFLLGLWIGDGEVFQLSMDNHLPLEQLTCDFEQKRRWFDPKIRYQWFNNMVAYLDAPDDFQVDSNAVGEIVDVAVNGSQSSPTIFYGLRYSDAESHVPYFNEVDLEPANSLSGK